MVSGQTTSHEIHIMVGASDPTSQHHYNPPIYPVGTNQFVHVGETVTWTNDDETFHTVTSGEPSSGPNFKFDSGIISPGQSFTWEFSNPDDYKYYCTIHPFMQGVVKVR